MPPRGARLLSLALLLGLLSAACALPAQSAALKRKKKRRAGSVELRLLNESAAAGGGGAPDFVALATRRYLNNQELGEWLQSFEKRCKSIARLTKIGTSKQNKCVASEPPAAAQKCHLPLACHCRCAIGRALHVSRGRQWGMRGAWDPARCVQCPRSPTTAAGPGVQAVVGDRNKRQAWAGRGRACCQIRRRRPR